MGAEGTLCGFIYLEGSTRGGPEDTEPLALSTLGIPDSPGKTGVCVRFGWWWGSEGGPWLGPAPPGRPRPSMLTRAELVHLALHTCSLC